MTRVSGLNQTNLRNRSSKHLRCMTGPGSKNVLRCVSNAQLQDWSSKGVAGAAKEVTRRAKKGRGKKDKIMLASK